MNVADLRAYLLQFARNAKDGSMYGDAELDRVGMAIMDDFNLRVSYLKTQTLLTLAAGSAALPAWTTTGFRPDRLRRAYLFDAAGSVPQGRMQLLAYDDLYDMQLQGAITGGLPQFLACDSLTTGLVQPTPQVACQVKLLWIGFASNWIAGDASSSAAAGTLNIPDDLLRPCLIYGGTALLQHTEPEHAYASKSWQQYLEFVERAKSFGAGGLGKAITLRGDPQGRGGPRRQITGWTTG